MAPALGKKGESQAKDLPSPSASAIPVTPSLSRRGIFPLFKKKKSTFLKKERCEDYMDNSCTIYDLLKKSLVRTHIVTLSLSCSCPP